MIYSNLYLKNNNKLPTILGIIIIGFLLLFFIRLFSQSSIPSKAVKIMVKRIELTNISPHQVTIFWQTDNLETGWVIYGEKKNDLNNVAINELDLPSKKNPRLNQYVVLKNLKENKQYFYKLVISDQLVSNINSEVLEFMTPKDASLSKREPAYGKVIKSNSLPLENAIVLINLNNSYPLSAVTKSTGEWLISLGNLYERNNLKPINPSTNESVKIEIISQDNQLSEIITSLEMISPLPQTTIIGQNFNFIEGTNVLSATSNNLSTGGEKKDIDIIYPQENALIPGFIPRINGLALPNTEVMITVNSERSYSSRVKSNSKGEWQLLLSERLSLGRHTVTIMTTDRNDQEIKIARDFIIVGNEGNDAKVLGVASGEPTLTLSQATPTPTYYSTSSGTIKPTTPVSGFISIKPLVGASSFFILGLGLLLVF